jgi:hypothetical protein
MKRLILMALGAVAVYRVAKHYGIGSLDDVKKLLKPTLKEMVAAL